MIGTYFEGYKLLERLGGGTNGVVYKAFDSRQNHYVAIKILLQDVLLSEEKIHRFMREAQASVILSHDHIARMHAVGDSRGTHYIVMDYIQGQTFGDIVRKHPQGVTLKAFAGLMKPVLSGMVYAHSQGIVHRDLKPENLILDTRGKPVIVDFGLSKMVDLAMADGYNTVSGLVIGSAGYMAPEQAQGEAIDERSDIFSLGTIMYELLSGKNPFADPSPVMAIQKSIVSNPVLIELVREDVPISLGKVIAKAMAKDRARRYATMASFQEAVLAELP
jgi:serine/threonine-protein kinase